VNPKQTLEFLVEVFYHPRESFHNCGRLCGGGKNYFSVCIDTQVFVEGEDHATAAIFPAVAWSSPSTKTWVSMHTEKFPVSNVRISSFPSCRKRPSRCNLSVPDSDPPP
jgi:hypothetical protein